MNALKYKSNSTAAWVRDCLGALFARVAALMDGLRDRELALRETLAHARAIRKTQFSDFGPPAFQESPEGVTDVVEPSMTELQERLAALRENIRRARERHANGVRDLFESSAAELPDDAEARHVQTGDGPLSL